jgi:hypothetical protein
MLYGFSIGPNVSANDMEVVRFYRLTRNSQKVLSVEISSATATWKYTRHLILFRI